MGTYINSLETIHLKYDFKGEIPLVLSRVSCAETNLMVEAK